MLNTTRRDLMIYASFLPATGLTYSQTKAEVGYSDPDATEKWMKTWMNAPGAVAGGLFFGKFFDRIWFLTKMIEWTPNAGQEHLPKVNPPEGFVTDLTSIPRIFWSFLPPDGSYAYAAVIHDYLYWTQNVDREKADLIFKFAMEDLKINKDHIEAIHLAVRVGGEGAWENNRKLRHLGERRILKKYPDDPKVTWETWKKIIGNT